MGRYTSEALGDYCAGPNHVLPTSGTARFSSPLGVYDFQKRSSLIQVSAAGREKTGRDCSGIGFRRRFASARAIGVVQEEFGITLCTESDLLCQLAISQAIVFILPRRFAQNPFDKAR